MHTLQLDCKDIRGHVRMCTEAVYKSHHVHLNEMPSAIWLQLSSYDANDLGLSSDTTLQRLLSCRNASRALVECEGERTRCFLCRVGADPGLIRLSAGTDDHYGGRKSKAPAQSSLASRRVTCTSSADTGLSANSPSAAALLTDTRTALPKPTVRHTCRMLNNNTLWPYWTVF